MNKNRNMTLMSLLPILVIAGPGCDEGKETEVQTSAELRSAALEVDKRDQALAPGESSADASETPVEVPNPVVSEPETVVYEDFEALVAKLRAESPAFAEALTRPAATKPEVVDSIWQVPVTRKDGMRCNEPTRDPAPTRTGFVQARFDVPLAPDARLVLGPEGDDLAPPGPAKAKDPEPE